MKTLGISVASPHHATLPDCDEVFRVFLHILHIDPHLYVYVAMFSLFDIDPQCNPQWLQSFIIIESWIHIVSLGGHDLSLCLIHGSIMYLRRLFLVSYIEHRYAFLRILF